MIYVQLYNDCDNIIGEIEIKSGEQILRAISKSQWCLEPGDTIKVFEEERHGEKTYKFITNNAEV